METQGEAYFPVLLRLQGRRCVVVGPLEVAWDRARALRACGAEVRVVVPPADSGTQGKEVRDGIEVERRPFRADDLAGAWLVVSVVGDPAWNRELFQMAQARGVLCYAVDDPEHSHFILPAVGRRGPVVVAVSTGGTSPRLAQVLRDRCMAVVTELDERWAVLLGAIRPRMRQVLPDLEARRAFVDRLLASEVAEWLRRGEVERARQAAEALLEAWAGGAREEGPA